MRLLLSTLLAYKKPKQTSYDGKEMIDAKQVRAARALLNWSQADLVERAKLSPTTIKRMEADSIGPGKSAAENVARVQDAFEAAGVIFIASNGEGAGVRMRKVSE